MLLSRALSGLAVAGRSFSTAHVAPLMANGRVIEALKPKVYGKRQIEKVLTEKNVSKDYDWKSLIGVANVMPFRSNNYICDNLIDWNNIPNDPIFQLTFPQQGMLHAGDLSQVVDLIDAHGMDGEETKKKVADIRLQMNPVGSGQHLNKVIVNGKQLNGLQHKYEQTVLLFPVESQYCHTFCTYCFRWAQFSGLDGLVFATKNAELVHEYLRQHPKVTDMLITGGDPMVMKAHQLRRYIEPVLHDPSLAHIKNIRIGTKSLTYWPYRFVTDDDADDTLRLFEEVAAAGKHLAIMAHNTHPNEYKTDICHEAIRRIRMTGANLRCQSPIVRNINASSEIWADMWKQQLSLGMIPYYMFVERDTGPKIYFELPLTEVYDIFVNALEKVSGLGRTVRGPSMSATPGKVCVVGTPTINGEKVMALKFLQGRKNEWTHQPFFAKYDPEATWLNHLKPAFGEEKFFFEDEMAEIEAAH